MADLGHQLTDKELAALEKRIAREYAIAAKDMRRKLREYMEQFEEGKAAQKALLDAGKITLKEYKDWVYRHTMMGNQWRDMKNVLAEDMRNASDIALRMSRDQMADIYALNANYAMFQIEHDFGIDTGFTLYNHDTAEYLLSEQRQLMPGPSARKAKEIAENKAMQWNRQKIQSAVLQGVLQGESPYEVAKRLMGVAQMGYNASVRYARTMTTSAQNAGRYNSYRRAKGLGVDLTIEWQATLDGRTRHEHRMMHGQRRDVDEPFEVDGVKILYPAQSDGPGSSDIPQSMIWNCFVGDTKVASDCEIVRSYKHKFKGNLIRVRTAAGVDFTCTPNHPILTPNGWIPAAFLHKGDHLLITRVGDDGSLTRNGNVYHVHSSIKALHDSLESLGNSERISMSNFDFHGDVPTSDVEVVSKERLLRNDGNTCGGQSSRKIRFKLSNAFRLCERHFMLGFRRIYISSLRFVRGCCKPLTLIWRRLRHADIHGFGTVSNRDTCVSEYAINDLPTVTNIRSELLDGLAGNVFVDDVVSVDRKPGRLLCHVYNLQTESGYYFVGNSIPQNGEKYNGNYYAIAKNCRCTLLAWVKGFEGDTVKSSPKMEGMSFEEWQHAKEPKKPSQKGKNDPFVYSLIGSKKDKTAFGYVFGDIGETCWTDYSDNGGEKITTIEDTVAKLQQRYPMQSKNGKEYNCTVDRVVVCDYSDAYRYLPDGKNDRRIDFDATAQVFENTILVDGKEVKQAVIAVNRDWLSVETTLEDAVERRAERIAQNKMLWNVGGFTNGEATVIHEWGHIFSNHMASAMIYDEKAAHEYWEWYKTLSKEEIKNGISDYAATNRGEFEAECFLEMQMPNPRPLAVKWWSYMQKVLEMGY